MAVEGVVIVGSILLAFGIDAWWETLGQRDEAQSAVVSLEADFGASRDFLDSFRRSQERTIASIDSVSDFLRGRTGRVEVPARLLAWVVRTPSFAPPTGALEALLSSGRLTLLEDPELERALAAWPSHATRLAARADLALGYVTDQLLPVLSRHTDIEPVLAYRAWQQAGSLRQGEAPESDVILTATDEVRNSLHARRYHTVELVGASWFSTMSTTAEILDGLAGWGS